MLLRFIIFVSIIGFAAFGCQPPEIDFSRLNRVRKPAVETARDVAIFYTDSAQLKVKIEGKTLERYTTGANVEEIFPDGIYVEFYSPSGRVSSWLTSKYAVRDQAKKTVIARDSVVLINSDGEKLETDELIWDERKEEIYSNVFVKITRGQEVITSFSFKSNEDFTRYELKSVEGDMLFDELTEDLD